MPSSKIATVSANTVSGIVLKNECRTSFCKITVTGTFNTDFEYKYKCAKFKSLKSAGEQSDVDRFYIQLFPALKQTHCTRT